MSQVDKQIRYFEKEAEEFRNEADTLDQEIAAASKDTRSRLLNEFDAAIAEIETSTDDYRKQEQRFISFFCSMKKEAFEHLESLRKECNSLRGEEQ